MVSYGGLGELRELSRSGRLEVVPCHYSALPRMFAERRLPCDVGLRAGVAARRRRLVLARHRRGLRRGRAAAHAGADRRDQPRRCRPPGAPRGFRCDRFAATIATDRPLPEEPARATGRRPSSASPTTSPTSSTTATRCNWVSARWAAAVLDALAEHQDLGFHTGMITDGAAAPGRQGRGHRRRKEIDPGLIVAGTALGSRRAVQPGAPSCRSSSCRPATPMPAGAFAAALAGVGQLRRRGRPERPGRRRGQPRRATSVPSAARSTSPGRRTDRQAIDHRAARRHRAASPRSKPPSTAGLSPPRAPTSTPSSPSTASHTCAAAASANGPAHWSRSPPRSFETSSTRKVTRL